MTQPLPAFALRMNNTYNAAVAFAFILHGNGVIDYADNENGTIEGVLNRLWGNHAIVAHYSMANGLIFPSKENVRERSGKKETVVESPSRDEFIKAIGSPTGSPEDILAQFKDVNKAIPLFDGLLRTTGKSIPVTDENGKPRIDDNGMPMMTTQPYFALIVHMCEFIIPDGDMAVRPQNERKLIAIMERWGRDPEIMKSGNVVVLTARNLADVHQRLRFAGARYEAIEMQIPDYDDRLAYIKFVRARPSSAYEYGDVGGGSPGKGDEAFARLTAGLSRVGIEDIVYKVPKGEKLMHQSVTERKDEIIRTEYADVIEMLDPSYGFASVGGYVPIKQMFAKRIVARVKDGLPSDWPGVLLVGPPGTGKTTLAVALAYECGIPALRLNIGALKNKFVGETEKNLRRALGLIREMAPVLVFIDEIDTALPNRQDENQDSGVSKGILEAFMPFLSDPDVRKKTQFVAASNRSDGIDAALKRVGRLDKIIPMLMPVKQERIEIIEALWPIEDAVKAFDMPKRAVIAAIAEELNYPIMKVTIDNKEIKTALADMDVGWSGSEIRGLIRAAGEEMRDDPELKSEAALTKAKEYVIANTADVLRLTALALADCNDLRLLPESYRKEYDRAKWAQEAKMYGSEQAVTSTVERQRRNN